MSSGEGGMKAIRVFPGKPNSVLPEIPPSSSKHELLAHATEKSETLLHDIPSCEDQWCEDLWPIGRRSRVQDDRFSLDLGSLHPRIRKRFLQKAA
jgi:hypothetical protein